LQDKTKFKQYLFTDQALQEALEGKLQLTEVNYIQENTGNKQSQTSKVKKQQINKQKPREAHTHTHTHTHTHIYTTTTTTTNKITGDNNHWSIMFPPHQLSRSLNKKTKSS